MRQNSTFWPSLAISVLLNLMLFAVLQPIQVSRSVVHSAYRLHRLQRVVVKPNESTTDLPLTTPEPAALPPEIKPAAPPAARPATSHVRTAHARTKPSARTRRRSAGTRRAQLGPALPGRIAQALGGDGTRTTADAPDAGRGDSLLATPRSLGDPKASQQLGPAFSRIGAQFPMDPGGPVGPVHDGPPLIAPGSGPRGGTPLAPTVGRDPLPGTAGSGDNPNGLAPVTSAGFSRPLAPTTPGPKLRPKAGPGLPEIDGALVVIGATTVDPNGHSGGGGGTAHTPGIGGGGPPLAGADRLARTDGGGGSGMSNDAPQPGGLQLGAGPGGTGGGGNGLALLGQGGAGDLADGRPVMAPVPVVGEQSLLTHYGHGQPDGQTVRPGKRAPGPGGPPTGFDPEAAVARPGGGNGDGTGPGEKGGPGGSTAVATADQGQARNKGGYTGIVVDTLGLQWHHAPGSYDIYVGSSAGKRLATIGIYHYRSVASAQASRRVQRDGAAKTLVIKPLAIEYVVAEGSGARQRVVISAADAGILAKSGLLKERERILTVYRDNF